MAAGAEEGRDRDNCALRLTQCLFAIRSTFQSRSMWLPLMTDDDVDGFPIQFD